MRRRSLDVVAQEVRRRGFRIRRRLLILVLLGAAVPKSQ